MGADYDSASDELNYQSDSASDSGAGGSDTEDVYVRSPVSDDLDDGQQDDDENEGIEDEDEDAEDEDAEDEDAEDEDAEEEEDMDDDNDDNEEEEDDDDDDEDEDDHRVLRSSVAGLKRSRSAANRPFDYSSDEDDDASRPTQEELSHRRRLLNIQRLESEMQSVVQKLLSRQPVKRQKKDEDKKPEVAFESVAEVIRTRQVVIPPADGHDETGPQSATFVSFPTSAPDTLVFPLKPRTTRSSKQQPADA